MNDVTMSAFGDELEKIAKSKNVIEQMKKLWGRGKAKNERAGRFVEDRMNIRTEGRNVRGTSRYNVPKEDRISQAREKGQKVKNEAKKNKFSPYGAGYGPAEGNSGLPRKLQNQLRYGYNMSTRDRRRYMKHGVKPQAQVKDERLSEFSYPSQTPRERPTVSIKVPAS